MLKAFSSIKPFSPTRDILSPALPKSQADMLTFLIYHEFVYHLASLLLMNSLRMATTLEKEAR